MFLFQEESMDSKAALYGVGGLVLGVVLTILIGVAGMAGMMGGMGRMMMRNMCGYQGSVESPDANYTANQPEQVIP
jgi:hypothetical protein